MWSSCTSGCPTETSTRGSSVSLETGAVQAHGLGTLLLEHLASVARHREVRRFVAEVLAQNQRMIHLIADAGLTVECTPTVPRARS